MTFHSQTFKSDIGMGLIYQYQYQHYKNPIWFLQRNWHIIKRIWKKTLFSSSWNFDFEEKLNEMFCKLQYSTMTFLVLILFNLFELSGQKFLVFEIFLRNSLKPRYKYPSNQVSLCKTYKCQGIFCVALITFDISFLCTWVDKWVDHSCFGVEIYFSLTW